MPIPIRRVLSCALVWVFTGAAACSGTTAETQCRARLPSLVGSQQHLLDNLQADLEGFFSAALKCRGCGGCDQFQSLEQSSPECSSLAKTERNIRGHFQSYLRIHDGKSAFLAYGEIAYFFERLSEESTTEWQDRLKIGNWESYRGVYRESRRGMEKSEIPEADISIRKSVVVVGLPVFGGDGFVGALYVTYEKSPVCGENGQK